MIQGTCIHPADRVLCIAEGVGWCELCGSLRDDEVWRAPRGSIGGPPPPPDFREAVRAFQASGPVVPLVPGESIGVKTAAALQREVLLRRAIGVVSDVARLQAEAAAVLDAYAKS